jgi:hypothetical protein
MPKVWQTVFGALVFFSGMYVLCVNLSLATSSARAS